MTIPVQSRPRIATPRRYLMCRPTHFDVSYAINPWMEVGDPVDRDRALAQWEALKATYAGLGHRVDVLEGEPGLPDMVFAANGGLVVGGRGLSARFRHAERTGEQEPYHRWLEAAGVRDVRRPQHVNEGEGDFLAVGGVVLAGTGFRTDPEAHREVAHHLGREVVSLQLVDPRFYHLDTCLAVLTDEVVAVYAPAFAPTSLQVLRSSFSVLEVAEADAVVLGLNAVSDGRNVVLEAAATGFAAQLRAEGFAPHGVDLSELRKAGGAVKCCTLELRGVPVPAAQVA